MPASPWLSRLYRNSLLCWPLLALGLAALGWRCGVGAALGGGVSLLSLWSFDRLVAGVAAGRSERRLRMALALRYPLLLLVVGAVLQWGAASPAGFCAGVGLVPLVAAVMAAKALVTGVHA